MATLLQLISESCLNAFHAIPFIFITIRVSFEIAQTAQDFSICFMAIPSILVVDLVVVDLVFVIIWLILFLDLVRSYKTESILN